jgi:hypothetical protein
LIPDAIERVLSEAAEPMRARDIHAAVEELLGQPVSVSSVKNWLAKSACGDAARLTRLGWGRYRLTSPRKAKLSSNPVVRGRRDSLQSIKPSLTLCWSFCSNRLDSRRVDEPPRRFPARSVARLVPPSHRNCHAAVVGVVERYVEHIGLASERLETTPWMRVNDQSHKRQCSAF